MINPGIPHVSAQERIIALMREDLRIRGAIVPENDLLWIFDSLESVTNGMENAEAQRFLAEMADSHPLAPWRDLILAIQAFYRGNTRAMLAFAARIPADSMPSHLAGLFKLISNPILEDSVVTGAESIPGFIRRIMRQREDIAQSCSMIEDYTQELMSTPASGYTQALSEAIAEQLDFVLQELETIDGTLAARVAAWAVQNSAIGTPSWAPVRECLVNRGYPVEKKTNRVPARTSSVPVQLELFAGE